MFERYEKTTGTQYTFTIALLTLAFVFCPALLLLWGRLGFVPISLAVITSTLCVVLAWLNWTKYSRLTIPSLEDRPLRSK
jgi:hypothetical protein